MLKEPLPVWKYFLALTQIPRGSNDNDYSRVKSARITKELSEWSKSADLPYYIDTGGNIIIRKAAQNCTSSRTVCLQCHMDMVCEKNENCQINFDTDPLKPYIDGDYIKAEGTTLGADNGIGVATVLAILDDKTIVHPNLEILITRDEEKGLRGATELEKKILKSEYLINIDSEMEYIF